MLEFDLLRKASKKEAQERAGYDDAQWKEFYNITKAEMDELVAGNPDITWTTVPKDELSKIHESVNGKLRTIQIPEIKKDVFEWRMARGLQDKASTKAKKRAKIAAKAGTSPSQDDERE
ncbi:hypothetical protein ACJQWK_03076 [Exserohilum turcicum]